MDRIDREILYQLQLDGRMPNNELADRVGLSPSPCHRRVRQLRDTGVIRRFTTVLDPTAIGRGYEVLLWVTLRTVTNFRVDRTDRPRPLGEVLGDLDRIVADLDHFEFYVFPHTETALCRESTRTQAPAQPPSPTSVYAQEVMVENWVAAAFVQIARRVPSATPALSRLAAACPTLCMATPYRVATLDDAASCDAVTDWWTQLTADGGEGMVVKPADFIVQGDDGLLQPAIKVRGREYLRIIYGPEYTAARHLERLRRRGTARKRSLALREFALGVEAIERFVAREPLRRVHECVFGVLALESEPVDPRL